MQSIEKLGYITYVSATAAQRYIDDIENSGRKTIPGTLLLVNDGDYIDLKVAAFVAESSCEKAHLRTIDRFSKRTRQWESPAKFDLTALRSNNFGCPLLTYIPAGFPEIIWPNENEDKGENFSQLSGYFTKITNELTKRTNFSINLQHTGMTFDSDNEMDLILMGISNEGESVENDIMIDLISIYREIIVVIPLNDFYSGLEKLFLPFDVVTWILITITFAIGLITIMIVTQLSRTIQSFVIGRDVTAPTMNLLAAFFGLGQTQLPSKNFARFLLMLYIIWCLIFRTAYQGVLYDLLKSDGRRPQNTRLEDFIVKNATIHVNVFCYYAVHKRTQFRLSLIHLS